MLSSPENAVPQTMLSADMVPHTMLSLATVPHTMLSQAPQLVPHTMLSRLLAARTLPHTVERAQAFAFGWMVPPESRWFPQTICLLHLSLTGTLSPSLAWP